MDDDEIREHARESMRQTDPGRLRRAIEQAAHAEDREEFYRMTREQMILWGMEPRVADAMIEQLRELVAAHLGPLQ